LLFIVHTHLKMEWSLTVPEFFHAEYIDRLRGAIKHLLDEARHLTAENGGGFKPGSQAETEHSTYVKPDTVYGASAIGVTLIEMGADHLSVFSKILVEPVEVTATLTCVRSMMETCGLATWLLDPNIDATARVSRVFARRYEGMQQQVKFARAAGFPATDIDAQKARIDAVERDALALGFKRIEDRFRKRIGIAEQMPSATELIKITLDEEKMYRALSAVAHGHHWAIQQLCYEASESDDEDVGGTKTKAFKKQASIDKTAWVGLCAVRALIRPVWNQCRYFGWNHQEFEELFENVADRLSVKAPPRFWRTYPAVASTPTTE
jgi:hypothetical protein